MNPIPTPLFKKLVLTFLAGTGCFFIGLILSVTGKDRTLFFLSLAVFLFSLIRGLSFYLQFKSGSYTVLEGICTNISMLPFRKTYRASLKDNSGTEHDLRLIRTIEMHPGFSYRIYLDNSSAVLSEEAPFLHKTMAADNLLGVEQIASSPQDTDEKQEQTPIYSVLYLTVTISCAKIYL